MSDTPLREAGLALSDSHEGVQGAWLVFPGIPTRVIAAARSGSEDRSDFGRSSSSLFASFLTVVPLSLTLYGWYDFMFMYFLFLYTMSKLEPNQ